MDKTWVTKFCPCGKGDAATTTTPAWQDVSVRLVSKDGAPHKGMAAIVEIDPVKRRARAFASRALRTRRASSPR